MNINLNFFKKITCILGITFLILGMIPLPLVSKVATVVASVEEEQGASTPKALGLPNLVLSSSKNIKESVNDKFDSITPAWLSGISLFSIKAAPPACVYSEWGPCSVPCGGGTQTRTLTSGSPGQCTELSQTCNTQACTPTPVDCSGHWGDCSVPCGGGTQSFIIDIPAQNGGAECTQTTQACNTEACAPTCKPNGDSCAASDECCSGNCNGVNGKCADPNTQCKDEGGPCGGNNVCCPGLTCITTPNHENDKCGYPPPPDVDCVGSWSACEGSCGTGTQTFTITIPQSGEGQDCEAGNGDTRPCPLPACCQPTGSCPTTCGYDGTDIPDGCGGTIACEPTAACPPIDNCPDDPDKMVPGVCGCGIPDVDSDGDGTLDCLDNCSSDPDKVDPGTCGCGTADVDSDGDHVLDCQDNCVNDPNKIEPGICGCGVTETDTDGDGTLDCVDECDVDAAKITPGACGCGVADTDTDGDGIPDCNDICLNDPLKTEPGICGCGVSDIDSDGDGIPECNDTCLDDPLKSEPGICGCGVADIDSDGDGTPDCIDLCPNDFGKVEPGVCGCSVLDNDSDGDGLPDCTDECVEDPNKLSPGFCGCGVADFTCITESIVIGDPVCVSMGGWYLGWTITNPNSMAVPVTWTLDGSPGGATLPAGGSLPVGNTLCGPSNHTLIVNWPGGGSATYTSNKTCGNTDTNPGGGDTTNIIPVTGGAGVPADPLIIPVTGVDQGVDIAGLQKWSMLMGLMLFGFTMVLEGFDLRRKK